MRACIFVVVVVVMCVCLLRFFVVGCVGFSLLLLFVFFCFCFFCCFFQRLYIYASVSIIVLYIKLIQNKSISANQLLMRMAY